MPLLPLCGFMSELYFYLIPRSFISSKYLLADKIQCLQPYQMKGKAVPLQAWSGPEGSRNLKFPDFMTTAQDIGKVVSLTHRPPLPQGNVPGTHFC